MIDTSSDPAQPEWTVIRCINWVAKHLGPIAKADRAKDVPFSFRGIERIMAAAAPLMIEAGIVTVPQAELLSHDPITKGRGGWTVARTQVTWHIYGPQGDFVVAKTLGIGEDNADKGANKAQTQAWKYLLMPLLLISDPADDGDRHNTTDEYVRDHEGEPSPEPADTTLMFDALGWPGGQEQHDAELEATKDVFLHRLNALGRKDAVNMLKSLNNGSARGPFAKGIHDQYSKFVRLLAETATTRVAPPPDLMAALEESISAAKQVGPDPLAARAAAEREAEDPFAGLPSGPIEGEPDEPTRSPAEHPDAAEHGTPPA